MSNPPSQIDDARVIEWAWSGEKPFGYLPDSTGNVAAEIYGFAICQYHGSKKLYRFSCNARWESEQDSVYNTIEEAKSNIPMQYREVKPVWWKV